MSHSMVLIAILLLEIGGKFSYTSGPISAVWKIVTGLLSRFSECPCRVHYINNKSENPHHSRTLSAGTYSPYFTILSFVCFNSCKKIISSDIYRSMNAPSQYM